jgi:hypothetical protein
MPGTLSLIIRTDGLYPIRSDLRPQSRPFSLWRSPLSMVRRGAQAVRVAKAALATSDIELAGRGPRNPWSRLFVRVNQPAAYCRRSVIARLSFAWAACLLAAPSRSSSASLWRRQRKPARLGP